MTARELWQRFFLIRTCASCGELLRFEEREEAFCPSCREVWDKEKVCSCGQCLQSVSECRCMSDKLSKSGMLALRRLTFYETDGGSASRRAVLFLKDNRNRRVAKFFALQLAFVLREECVLLGVSPTELVVTYAPRSDKAVLRRGFDQAALIAEALAETVGAEYAALLVRRRGGKEQKSLNLGQRQRNVGKRFALGEEARHVCADRTVVLLDDIVTTGASMSACATLLRRAGARGVLGLCISSVPKTKGRQNNT